ncbi:UDP-N-acetylenolpyruvoylglucosamine reductase 1 [Halovibrio variabilis]|uniref:UDP-N-acetylenolpyruvoylglucosamine reductase n=1 Tax=Halovibrio variabilis TaxID=31910 RepID=A0A511UST6_9GAMM|nr:UDP-N-acetylmuramate dehydrogenase [Halovibrio variabilis]GEN29660.1 UDP-N-acetylenolpyruvoylglucosamine reductase 1 [Halovibrio variabilis]
MNPVTSSAIEALKNIKKLQVQTGVSLAEFSNWKVGGRATVLVRPTSVEETLALRKFISENQLPSLVIGNTTNLLFTDEDIDAVFIKIGSDFSKVELDGNIITAQAGVWAPKLARFAMQGGLAGIEHTCGIPGTLGGLVVMNGGSQRKGIGDNITYVKTAGTEGKIKKYNNEQCQFGYRSSIFQELDEVILEVGLELAPTISKKTMHAEMLSILRSRSKKFPRKLPNCGSVFVSNPAMYKQYGPPGKVIEESGLKGLNIGGAQISPEHANFIVNIGSATAKDILELINMMREEVYEKTGYLMEVEPKHVNACGEIKRI